MKRRRDLILVGGLSLGLIAASLLAYLLADRLTPAPLQFAGFLLNPWDGFSYLAKMNQGAHGSLFFTLPYASEPGTGALVFSFYLALGWLASVLRLDFLTTLHAARVVNSVLMAAACAFFLWRVLPADRSRGWALTFLLFGAGLGWLAGPMGVQASDLYIPESVPFQAALINPHFPLATALVAVAAGLIVSGGGRLAALAAALIGFGLGGVLPFAAMPVALAGAIWVGVEWWTARRTPDASPDHLNLPLVGLLVGLGPWFVYDLWLLSSHPVLQIWNAQNLTPSPPLTGYLTGLGPALVLVAIGVGRRMIHRDRLGRFLLIWLAVHFVLAYAPLNVQRRTMLGVALPLTALVGMTLAQFPTSSRAVRWLWSGLLVIGLPTNLLVASAGVARAAAGDPLLTISPDERAGYRWFNEHVPSGSLVLAAPISGNRLPGYAQVQVLYGHPFETPNAGDAEAQVIRYFGMTGDPGLEAAASLGADYVLVGRHEAFFGASGLSWADDPVASLGDTRIFEVAASP